MKNITWLFLLILFASCEKADKIDNSATNCDKWTLVGIQEPFMSVSTRSSIITDEEHIMALGKQLENPYSVNTMLLAYNNLKKRGDSVPDIEIKATHLYLKFNLKDSIEFENLKELKTVEFYSYPLDYEILSEGVCSDPIADNDGIPTLWAAIRIDQLSQVGKNYEILDYLYIPEESVALKNGEPEEHISEEFIENLEQEAFKITNNDNEEEMLTRSSKRWHPNGRIQVYDDAVNCIMPLEGVKVRARRWFTTRIMYTDRHGYFESSRSFRGPVNYSIIWESDYWDIRSGIFGQATYRGPKERGAWNLYIENGKTIRYAHIHRAAFRWFYKNTYGLARPLYLRKIKIAYRDKNKSHSGDFWRNITLGILPDIRIFRSEKGRDLKTYNIFATTIHELGHASHASHSHIFGKTKRIILDSWAAFTEDLLTENDYMEWTGKNIFTKIFLYHYMNRPLPLNYPNKLNKQGWRGGGYYTPLFIDIHDNSNQRLLLKLLKQPNANNYVNDNITIADVEVIQEIAFSSKTVTDVKNKLKALAGKTSITFSEQDVDNLFEFY